MRARRPSANCFRNEAEAEARGITSCLQVFIHPSSALCGKKADTIVFSELMHTTKTYARELTVIEPAWLPELAPLFFASKASAASGSGSGHGLAPRHGP